MPNSLSEYTFQRKEYTRLTKGYTHDIENTFKEYMPSCIKRVYPNDESEQKSILLNSKEYTLFLLKQSIPRDTPRYLG